MIIGQDPLGKANLLNRFKTYFGINSTLNTLLQWRVISKAMYLHKQYELNYLNIPELTAWSSVLHTLIHQDCIWNYITLKACVRFSDQGSETGESKLSPSTETVMSSVGACRCWKTREICRISLEAKEQILCKRNHALFFSS